MNTTMRNRVLGAIAGMISVFVLLFGASNFSTKPPPLPMHAAFAVSPSGALLVGNTAVNGPIGGLTAAQSVDNYSSFVLTQTSLADGGLVSATLPAPTNATPGRQASVSNAASSSQSIQMYGNTLPPGALTTFQWDGAAWGSSVGPACVELAPSGGDDGPHFTSTFATAAAAGRCVRLLPGAFSVLTVALLPNNFTLYGSPGTVINCNVPDNIADAGISSSNSCLFAQYASVPGGVVGTLAANTVPGVNSISVTVSSGTPVAPFWAQVNGITNSQVAESAYVEAVSGSGPYTFTLRDPIIRSTMLTTGSGNSVIQGIPPQNIRIYGSGITMYGVPGTNRNDRAIELSSCQSCLIDGITFAGQWYAAFASFDIGSADCTYSNLIANGGYDLGLTPPVWGFAAEVAYRIKWDHVDVQGAGTLSGGCIMLNDCVDCDVVACHTDRCPIGFGMVVSGSADTTGPRRNRILGGSFNSSYVAAGDVATPRASGHGISASGVELDVIGADLAYNADFGAIVTAPSIAPGGAVRFMNVRSFLNANGAIFAQVPVEINGLTSRDDATNAALGTHHVIDLEFNTPTHATILNSTLTLVSDNALWEAIFTSGSGRVKVATTNIEMLTGAAHTELGIVTAGTNPIDVFGTTAYNGSGLVYTTGTSTTIRRGNNNTCIGTATCYTNGGDYFSWGTVTLNGTSGVAISFPDARADDILILTRKTAGTTTAITPTWTVTAGTGFTVTGATASDNDTYEYWVQ